MRLAERRSASGTLWWTLDHERRRNAVHPEMLAEITERCATLDGDVVVLTGAGSEAFCAGFDLTALLPSLPGASEGAPEAALIAATHAMATADATFIAALNGYAIGAGVELACSCDLRVGAPHTSFRVPATRLGVVYHPRGVARIRQITGESISRRMFLLDETVDARDLELAGALDRLVEATALEHTCEAWADTLRELAPLPLRAHRELFRHPPDRGPRASNAGASDPVSLRYAARRDDAYAQIAQRRRAIDKQTKK